MGEKQQLKIQYHKKKALEKIIRNKICTTISNVNIRKHLGDHNYSLNINLHRLFNAGR